MKRLVTFICLFLITGMYLSATDYCVTTKTRNRTDRKIQSCKIEGATLYGESQAFTKALTVPTSGSVYFNKTTDILQSTIGDELTISMEKTTAAYTWTCFYIWVDYNQNGAFEETEGELVSFTYYDDTDNGIDDGVDSNGEAANAEAPPFSNGSNAKKHFPKFVIPSTSLTGETRLRIVAQWNSKNPCGIDDMGTTGGFMLDYTINIHSATTTFPITLAQPVEGGSFVVKKDGTPITSGDEILAGTLLTVEPTLTSDDYYLKSVLVNGESVTGMDVRVTKAMEISLDIIKGRIVTFSKTGNGTLNVTSGGNVLSTGDVVLKGESITVKVVPDALHAVQTVSVNNQDYTADAVLENGHTFVLTENTDIKAVFNYLYCTTALTRTRSTNDHYLKSCTIEGATLDGEAQTFYSNNDLKVARYGAMYKSRIEEILKATRGDTLKVYMEKDPSYAYAWINFYVWIDYDQNGIFEESKGELVSYNYFDIDKDMPNDNGKDDGVDINGVAPADPAVPPLKNDGKHLPEFIIPSNAVAGKTALRIISQWNGKDPCGDLTRLPAEGGVIIDYTIDIHAAVAVATFPVVVTQPAEGGSLVVKKDGVAINSGDEVPAGTLLTIEPTLTSDDYYLKSVLVNGDPVTENQVVVDESIEISLDIIKGRIVTFESVGNGTFSITSEGRNLTSGDVVLKGKSIILKAVPNKMHILESASVNSQDQTAAVASENGYTFLLAENVDIQVVFEYLYCSTTLTRTREADDRYLKSCTIEGATLDGQNQNFSSNNNLKVAMNEAIYKNRLAEVLNASRGDVLKIYMEADDLYPYTGLNFYVWIDYDQNGIFEESKGELVSYNYFDSDWGTANDNQINDGVDIKGIVPVDPMIPPLKNNGKYLPEFKIPAGALTGETALRIISQWNGKDPCGNLSHLSADGGAIIDYLIDIHKGPNTTMASVKENEALAFIDAENNLVLKGVPSGCQVQIYTFLGQSVAQLVTSSENETIDHLPLVSGSAYLVKINGNGLNQVCKVVKN